MEAKDAHMIEVKPSFHPNILILGKEDGLTVSQEPEASKTRFHGPTKFSTLNGRRLSKSSRVITNSAQQEIIPSC